MESIKVITDSNKAKYYQLTAYEKLKDKFSNEEVNNSWLRSVTANVNPSLDRPPIVNLSKYDIYYYHQIFDELILHNSEVISLILSICQAYKVNAFLHNNEGFMVADIQNNTFFSDCYVLSENQVGTNAISLALQNNKSIRIRGIEHYNKFLHTFDCTCAPIHDEKGNIIGAINFYRSDTDTNPSILDMVSYLAKLIDNSYKNFFQNHPAVIEKNKMLNVVLENKNVTIDKLIGNTKEMLELKQLAKKLAVVDYPLVIIGEDGCEKDQLAHSIHNESKAKNNIFDIYDCSIAIQSDIENDLLGYDSEFHPYINYDQKLGKLEQIGTGTLLIKNFELMPINVQERIAQTILKGYFFKDNGLKQVYLEKRIIFTTCGDLLKLVESHSICENLYYQISPFVLYLPPLRDRKSDIISWINYFISNNKYHDDSCEIAIDKCFYSKVLSYDWPGNLMELKSTIDYSITIMGKQCKLLDEYLPEYIKKHIIQTNYKNAIENTTNDNSNLKTKAEMEKYLIQTILQQENYNISASAQRLGISRQTLYRKLKKYRMKG